MSINAIHIGPFLVVDEFRMSRDIQFYGCKNEKFQMKKKCDLFVIFARNRDCGYSIEPPHRRGSNGYPQSMFYRRNKKNNVYLCKPHFLKVGVSGD